jgi:pyruvate dehydrogenase E2 component (dihydrolipoamide acetyltransferase)
MPIPLLMPALSPTMTAGNLIKWHKKMGDQVMIGDTLLDIQTDKAIMEVEAVDAGILFAVLVDEETQNVPINTVLAVLQEEEDTKEQMELFIQTLSSSSGSSEKPQESQEERTSLESVSAGGAVDRQIAHEKARLEAVEVARRVLASPLAKKIAAMNDVSLESILGTGPRGRIIHQDVQNVLKQRESSGDIYVSDAIQIFQPMRSDTLGHEQSFASLANVPEKKAWTAMRKVIAERLSFSKQTVPHFYLSVDCQMDALLEAREKINQGLGQKTLSVTDFLVKACAQALQDLPVFNAQYHKDHILSFPFPDLAVAVSLEEGLITPILKSASQKSLKKTSEELKGLIQKAKSGQLKPEEYQGGTFTLSNLGMFGVDSFSAIVNPPQTGILAIGATVQKPVVKESSIVIASVMNVTLAADHRLIDGHQGALLLQRFKQYIEKPMLLLYQS